MALLDCWTPRLGLRLTLARLGGSLALAGGIVAIDVGKWACRFRPSLLRCSNRMGFHVT
jgi:hypothetical protein